VKSWTIAAIIFVLIGVLFLSIGLIKGNDAMDIVGQGYDSLSAQLRSSLFWQASQYWLVASVVCFIVGGVGLYVVDPLGDIPDLTQPPPQPVQNGAGFSQIRCGACSTMNDIDAIFCKKCGLKFR
jgi:hypothetical protein